MNDDLDKIRKVLEDNREQLLTRTNVVAVGIGYKTIKGEETSTLAIICSVVEKLPISQLSTKDMIPSTINDIPTDVIETGVIRAMKSRTDKWRPAPGGVSVGHIDITAGTLGCLVKKNGQTMILSNNHVLANSNDAEVGDPILQPGPHDGGKFPNDHIANLYEFVPIDFTGGDGNGGACPIARGIASLLNGMAKIIGSKARLQVINILIGENLVDAAIANPLNENDVSAEILEIGMITGLIQGKLGMNVKKSGRTTAVTTGRITQVNVTVSVQYGAGRIARFVDQIMTGSMAQGGDSGSALLDNNNNLTGLLFAGSRTNTIFNRIENVFSALRVHL
ncbi:MAG: hypothetical protein E3J23_07190 [Candidatus Stahlbacteria bacterium]|nr:MAG: hypothetical protein E3J23_07190 [Candidatus Stahlbacteria bacterium]